MAESVTEQPGVRQRRTMPTEVGVMLAEARMRCGWRRKEAARILGIAPTYLFNLEIGSRCPSVTKATQLAAGLALTEAERAVLLAVAVDDAGADHPAKRPAIPVS